MADADAAGSLLGLLSSDWDAVGVEGSSLEEDLSQSEPKPRKHAWVWTDNRTRMKANNKKCVRIVSVYAIRKGKGMQKCLNERTKKKKKRRRIGCIVCVWVHLKKLIN